MQSLNFTSVPTHFGEPQLAVVSAADWHAGQQQSPFSERIQFFNHTSIPIVVSRRDGLKFTLPPMPCLKSDQMVIRSEITIGPSVKKDIERVLSSVNASSSKELQLLREAYERQIAVNTYNGATLVLDYPISKDSLWSLGGTVYYNELDLLLSLHPFEDVPPHPRSEAGMLSQVAVDHDGVGFGYSIRMVDNAQRHGCRYINFSGKVYRVVPISDVSMRDGVYITSNIPSESGLSTARPEAVNVRHCSFEVAERDFGLYKSYEEAVNLGDMAAGRKQQLLEMEHELAKTKIDFQNAKSAHDRELFEINVKLKAMEAEKDTLEVKRAKLEHELEMEKMVKKDRYEERSYERKDQSEVLKILPTMIVGIGAVIALLVSLFKGPVPAK